MVYEGCISDSITCIPTIKCSESAQMRLGINSFVLFCLVNFSTKIIYEILDINIAREECVKL